MEKMQKRFLGLYPTTFYLNGDQPRQLDEFLHLTNLISPEETVLQAEKPGEGNMNYVLRVRTNLRSFIVKQSRPWVEKYPQLDAPIERIEVEARFYEVVSKLNPLNGFIPAVLDYLAESFLLALEDLGEATDFTSIYLKSDEITSHELIDLIRFISGLHSAKVPGSFPDNQPLKELNAEHIFSYPYRIENGFDLDSVQDGLQALSLPYKNNEVLKSAIQGLGKTYLQKGEVLIHGDYYPGSWLRTAEGTKIIDPEFACLGHAEFDMGVLVAHLKMAQTSDDLIHMGLKEYLLPQSFDMALCAGFCGAEILRRIIGLAQLPLDLTISEKARLLEWAATSVMKPTKNSFF